MVEVGPTSPAAARVHAGATFLDREHHGWWDWIDLINLNMMSATMCIAGQVEHHLSGGDYVDFLDRLRRGGPYLPGVAVELGFLPTDEWGQWEQWERYALRDMWRWEILARRKNPPKRPKLWWLTGFMHKFTKRDRDAVIW